LAHRAFAVTQPNVCPTMPNSVKILAQFSLDGKTHISALHFIIAGTIRTASTDFENIIINFLSFFVCLIIYFGYMLHSASRSLG